MDLITDRLAQSFRAIFEPHLAPLAEGDAPLGIHWCLSPAIAPMAALGEDGHPAKNLHLPPVPSPRRMWAGGAIEHHDALRVGDQTRRVSTIGDINRKIGRSGELWFVTVNHDYETRRGLAIRERHEIVYREAARPSSTPVVAHDAPTDARPRDRSWTIAMPPTLLFRYSAVSFNGHRIHYDHPYATGVEFYDGLVVHGPLQATLLLNLASIQLGAPPRRFSCRGLVAAIAGKALEVCAAATGDDISLWTQGPGGTIHMEAKASGA
ncbi:FAS1-like dehydratase domain-containing protein [Taklimakanibacter lacteus]|uniref:FAS1-like dehydratase domain-containing protein n=1 Tax=Taklimakanibacter lacteus TaxID=2268456 RepID=UPI0034D3DCD6